MAATEQAVVFKVEGSPVLGILHSPEATPTAGLVMLPAGGPQYHVGCCRQLLLWARRFADAGIAVLRFDSRGMGDSGGEYRRFHSVAPDLQAAVDQLLKHHPTLTQVALWGGCSAASAIMMHACKDPRVTQLIVLNPWAKTETTQARAELRYYLERLRDPTFWKKLIAGRLDIRKALSSFSGALGRLKTKPRNTPDDKTEDAAPAQATAQEDPQGIEEDGRFVEAMRVGLERFRGEVLLLMSGQSFIGREFDQVATSSRQWRRTVAAARITRRELPEAGHTFSTHEAQDAAFAAALTWLQSRN